jgi:(p)ppGpp synthase/HD superfamily hydrolase
MHFDGVVGQAFECAVFAHAGEFRRASTTPFIVHPVRVAMLVWPYVDELGIAAALLHDVVEMHGTDISKFPEAVREMVELLTRQYEGQPGEESKEDHIRRICATFLSPAILIKMADRIDNLTDGATSFGHPWLVRYLKHSKLLRKLVSETVYNDHPLQHELKKLLDTLP